MRDKISIFLIFVCLAISGFATPASDLFDGGAGEETKSEMGYIAITSNPPDAEIYVNDKLAGRTPSQAVPYTYQYKIWRQPLGLGYGEPFDKMCDAVLRISKKVSKTHLR